MLQVTEGNYTSDNIVPHEQNNELHLGTPVQQSLHSAYKANMYVLPNNKTKPAILYTYAQKKAVHIPV